MQCIIDTVAHLHMLSESTLQERSHLHPMQNLQATTHILFSNESTCQQLLSSTDHK